MAGHPEQSDEREHRHATGHEIQRARLRRVEPKQVAAGAECCADRHEPGVPERAQKPVVDVGEQRARLAGGGEQGEETDEDQEHRRDLADLLLRELRTAARGARGASTR